MTDLSMSKIPSLFGGLRTDTAPAKDPVLESPRPNKTAGKLTADAIKGLVAQKLSRKVM